MIGDVDAPAAAALVDGRTVHHGFDVDDRTWRADHLVCVGLVDDLVSHASALDAVLRGANLVIDVVADRLEAFLEDLRRTGVAVLEASPDELDRDTMSLLDELAAGTSIAEAAHRCHMSVRSAHRRLANARAALGVDANSALVATWTAHRASRGRR